MSDLFLALDFYKSILSRFLALNIKPEFETAYSQIKPYPQTGVQDKNWEKKLLIFFFNFLTVNKENLN
jgi:hypothetical protein